MVAALHGDLGQAGKAVERHEVTDDEQLGMTRQRAVGRHLDAAGAVDGGAGTISQQSSKGRGLHASRPDLGASLDAVALEVEAGGVDADDPRAETELDAQPLEVAPGAPAQALRVAGKHGVQGVEEHDARVRRIEATEVGAQRAS